MRKYSLSLSVFQMLSVMYTAIGRNSVKDLFRNHEGLRMPLDLFIQVTACQKNKVDFIDLIL